MRTSLALICSLALTLIFVAFVCAFATTSDHAINLGELAQSKSSQFARLTDDALAPLNPLVASIEPRTIKLGPMSVVSQIFYWSSLIGLVEEVPALLKIIIELLAPMLKLLMEYGFVFVLLLFFKNVSWTPTVLGVCLVLAALFFPSSALPEASKGRVKLLGIDLSFQGTLRLAAIMAGIVLIGGGTYQGAKGVKEQLPTLHHP
jgi:hypothetical protein